MPEGNIDRLRNCLQSIENILDLGLRSSGCNQMILSKGNITIFTGHFEIHEKGEFLTQGKTYRLRCGSLTGAQSRDENRGVEHHSHG